MSNNLVIESPDFDEIRKETGSSTEDAIRLLWFALNNEAQARQRKRFRWDDIDPTALAFAASAGTWTVSTTDISEFKTCLFDDFMMIQFDFNTTTTSAGMGTELYVQLPSSLQVVGGAGFFGVCHIVATGGGVTEIGIVRSQDANPQLLTLARATGAAWPSNETNTLYIQGFVIVQVE